MTGPTWGQFMRLNLGDHESWGEAFQAAEFLSTREEEWAKVRDADPRRNNPEFRSGFFVGHGAGVVEGLRLARLALRIAEQGAASDEFAALAEVEEHLARIAQDMGRGGE